MISINGSRNKRRSKKVSNRELSIWLKIDKPLLLLYLILVIFGIATVYSANFNDDMASLWSWGEEYGKQFYWVVISLLVGFLILLTEVSFIQNNAYIIYSVVMLLLVVVLFMPEINGAHSWFRIKAIGLTIQPAEFAKFATALVIAKYLNTPGVKIKNFSTKLTVFILLALPTLLIILEPDPGTALIFFSFIFVVYREGLSGNILLGGLFGAIIAVLSIYISAFEDTELLLQPTVSANFMFAGIVLLIGGAILVLIRLFLLPRYRKPKFKLATISTIAAMLLILITNWSYDHVFKERHRNRFQVIFGLIEDRQGEGYNIYQALAAIGSGESIGKGYLKGTLSNDKFKQVPEQSTDFIFCSWAEERGFIGSLVLIMFYVFFLIRCIIIAERQRSKFTRIFGYALASIFFFHFMINIGMVIGLAPVIGIPLPFFSKGGSAILGFSVLVFILLRLDAERKEVLR